MGDRDDASPAGEDRGCICVAALRRNRLAESETVQANAVLSEPLIVGADAGDYSQSQDHGMFAAWRPITL